jgi:hypothetical protein
MSNHKGRAETTTVNSNIVVNNFISLHYMYMTMHIEYDNDLLTFIPVR